MFYGREKELQELEERYYSGRFEFVPIYGRRRVGKTTLIKEFLKKHDGVFFTAKNDTLNANVDGLASAVFGVKVSASIESVFEEIKRRSKDNRYVLVIDEYPRIVKKNPSFGDHLQELIDDIHEESKLFLILCGSSISIMEHEVLGYKSSLYGRRTGSMKLLPLNVWDSMQFLKGFSRDDSMRIYGMVGGIPLYLGLFDSNYSLRDNVVRLFVGETSFFRNEHYLMFIEEMDHPFTYFKVMRAIADGKVNVGEIATYCECESSAATQYLNVLITMGLVGKRKPVDNPNGKMTRYYITDPFLKFQFSRMLPVLDDIDSDNSVVQVETILGLFETDMGHVFEDVCAEHMKRMYGGAIGTWWGTDRNTHTVEEIDVIASKMVDGKKMGWFAECKYRSGPVDTEVLNKLRYRITLVKGYSISHPVIYSKSGFTEAVINDSSVDLYTLDDVLGYDDNVMEG